MGFFQPVSLAYNNIDSANFGNDRNNDAGLYNSGWNRIIKQST